MESITVIIGNRIKRLRQILDLSQEEFANKIGANQRYLSYWELGKRNISIEYLMKIHTEFNISLEAFNLLEPEKLKKELLIISQL